MNKVERHHIDEAIKDEAYVVLPDKRTTICILTLDNGFTVRGESSCVDAKNFNKELGEKYSREDAVKKVWAFLGFRLADRLSLLAQAAS
uniref:Gp49 family protein n=1 Tax=Streptomyces sp. DSM 41634 TaxID=3448656 RepID=UPI00403FCC4B